MASTFTKAKERLLSKERMQNEMNKIIIDEITGCWYHPNKPTNNGYVQIAFTKKDKAMMHRIAYRLTFGDIPEGMTVDHKCHTDAVKNNSCEGNQCNHRKCCNPKHLQLLSFTDNVNLSVNKNRNTCPQGHLNIPSNRHYKKSGSSSCRECNIARMKRYNERVKNA